MEMKVAIIPRMPNEALESMFDLSIQEIAELAAAYKEGRVLIMPTGLTASDYAILGRTVGEFLAPVFERASGRMEA